MSCPVVNNNEFWLSYHITSRAHLPPTTQLIELEFQNHKLVDLEDVLEHVFRQGFVEPKHRPATWWERMDGCKLKSSHLIEDLLKQGAGKTPEHALKLVVEDIPTTFWFQYVYVNNPARCVTQRVKLNALPIKFERLAHVTNHIFAQGFLPSHVRPIVHWEKSCGMKLNESAYVGEILSCGQGVSEDKPLRLIVGDVNCSPVTHHTTPCPVYALLPPHHHPNPPHYEHHGHHPHHEPHGHLPYHGPHGHHPWGHGGHPWEHGHHPWEQHGHYNHCHN